MNENFNKIKRSEYVSDAYRVTRIPVFDLVGQESNPNSQTIDAFKALQVSIFNNGYVTSIQGVVNPKYNEDYDKKETMTDYEKICAVIQGGSGDSKSAGGEFATQVSDNSIREHFKYRIVDGQQRSSIVRLGTKYFMEDDKAEQKSIDWSNGKNIPEDPGKEMLKYLAWREDFCLPVTLLRENDEVALMSTTVLMNQARGEHSLDSTKDIVYTLINIVGKSEGWVAKNLFLDVDSVKKLNQLSGLKSAYSNINNTDLAWNPETDNAYIRKQNSYLNREASKYVNQYLIDHPDIDSGKDRDIGDIKEFAESLGWDREAALKIKQTAEKK